MNLVRNSYNNFELQCMRILKIFPQKDNMNLDPSNYNKNKKTQP